MKKILVKWWCNGARKSRMSDAESQTSRAMTYVVWGQVCFVGFIAVCVALHPGIVLKWNEGGVSNYGIHIKTALPYTIALALLAYYSRRAAILYVSRDPFARQLHRILNAYSLIIIVMLLSTYVYSVNHVLRDIHIGFGTVLITFSSVSSIWMFSRFRRLKWDGVFLIIQLTGALLALVTIVGVLHFLFLAEELANTGFACLLIHCARTVASDDRRVTQTSTPRTPLPLRRLRMVLPRIDSSPDR